MNCDKQQPQSHQVSESTLPSQIFVYREMTGPFQQAETLFKELAEYLHSDFKGGWMTAMPHYDSP